METEYSVLMSVYKAEVSDNLSNSLCSMLEQTLPPKQIVLVCDGPLTEQLDIIIDQFENQYSVLHVVRLTENRGLGPALNEGLLHCRNEFIVRMDSDDISAPDRCRKQLDFMQEYSLDLCSAAVIEFVEEGKITGQRTLPTSHKELITFAYKRNPMNHPCVVFRKGMVKKAGGYHHMPCFEDYDLWVRMILEGAKLGNYPEPLLYMRAGRCLYRRRSGFQYCRCIIRFWRKMGRIGFCGQLRVWGNIAVRCAVSMLPSKGVQFFYQNGLRTSEGKHDEAL